MNATAARPCRVEPHEANAKLTALLAAYHRDHSPVHVSFRDLLKTPATRDRVTHDIHPYPGRLLVNIPSFFLATDLTSVSDLVVDPFCGVGTVLLEALLAGRHAAGADANPLARLVTRAKLTKIPRQHLSRAARSLLARVPAVPADDDGHVLHAEYWFYPHVRRDLLRIRHAIQRTRTPSIRTLFLACFSACVKDVSLADPRLSVPVRLRGDQYPSDHWLYEKTQSRLRRLKRVDVLREFTRRLESTIHRVAALDGLCPNARLLTVDDDARAMSLPANTVDLVITSPPYIGAQKYIRSSSLSLTWLGMCAPDALRKLEDENIGREHFPHGAYANLTSTGLKGADILLARLRRKNPLRAHIAATYLREMRLALFEIYRVLRPGKHMILVAGSNSVCGEPFPTPAFLTDIALAIGFSLHLHLVDPIRSRALMTKRHHTAARIDAESILLFRKDA
jgi:DNA modification methylase